VLNWPPVGIGPSRLLLEMLKVERKCRFSNVAGILPVRLLLDKSRTSRFVRLQMDEGIGPVNLFELISSERRAFN
jgi:hypothetical protein